MKRFKYKTEIQIKNLFGGTIRWGLVYFYNIILKKEKPDRKEFVFGSKKEEDYYGHSNTQHKNTISAIISLFIIFALIAKLFKVLF